MTDLTPELKRCADLLSAVAGDMEDGGSLDTLRGKYVRALLEARDDARAALAKANGLTRRQLLKTGGAAPGEWLRILRRIVSDNCLTVDWLFGYAKETALPMDILAAAIAEAEQARQANRRLQGKARRRAERHRPAP